MRWWIVLALLALPVGAAPPNIVFILADDLGYSDVGFNGQRFYETPNIDRLAREGMILEQAYSGGPNCAPTRACMMTGCYVPRHKIHQPGAGSKGDPYAMKVKTPLQSGHKKKLPKEAHDDPPPFESRLQLDPAFVCIPEVLGEAGYKTARYGKWHLGEDTQGFDISSPDGVLDEHKHRQSFYGDVDVARRLTDASVAFIEDNREGPFYLYLAHYDVHTPIKAEEAVTEKYREKLTHWDDDSWEFDPVYAAMVEAVDTSVGRVLDQLDASGLADNTLVIFSSDNGGLSRVTSNLPLRAGKGSLYEGGVRVSTCARWPEVVEAGALNTTPITSVDWLPTFAELAGADLPESQPRDGVSMVPVLKGGSLEERSIFWHHPFYLSGEKFENFIPQEGGKAGEGIGWRSVPASSIRRGEWKLVEYFDDGRTELYHLTQDPGEQHEVGAEQATKRDELHAELKAWRKATGAIEPWDKNPYYGKKPE